VPTFDHDGLELQYDDTGHGPEVLFVHGATGTGAHEWRKLAPALGGTHRLLLPDLRGHGRSDGHPGAISLELVGADLRALIAHEAIPAPHVVGFSFGAEVVLELELAFPGTCRTMILISPGIGSPMETRPTRAQLEAGWPDALRRLHVERHGPDRWLDIMLELCERASHKPEPDLDAIAAIGCPILAIVGANDTGRRIKQARVLEGLHDRCEVVLIEDAGHAVHRERPDQVAAVIERFLCEHEIPARP
jgi:3-oxoadipate enol-lactonase